MHWVRIHDMKPYLDFGGEGRWEGPGSDELGPPQKSALYRIEGMSTLFLPALFSFPDHLLVLSVLLMKK